MDKVEQMRIQKRSWLTRYPYDCRTLWVIGYPRSGTSFIARVLGDALHCPVFSLDEVSDRDDPIVSNRHYTEARLIVRRGHFNLPDHTGGQPIPFKRNRGSKIVHVTRDPRDVLISAYHYFTFDHDPKNKDKELERVAKQLCGIEKKKPPLLWDGKNGGGWPGYVKDWTEVYGDAYVHYGIFAVGQLRYEDAVSDSGARRIQYGVGKSGIGMINTDSLQDALENNTPEAWEERKDKALKFMRKIGEANSRDEIPAHVTDMVLNECGPMMEKLGYQP